MLPQNEIKDRMIELAKMISYEYDDIGWLTKAMHCEVIGRKAGGGRNRDNYSNGQLVALGNSILKLIVAEELFDKGKSLSEVDNHKNRPQDYMALFRVDMASQIYAYAYGDHVFYDAFMHPPLPAHDLYIEAVVGAIYKDKGLEYTRRWAKEFFAKYGYELGEDPIYANLTNKELTEQHNAE